MKKDLRLNEGGLTLVEILVTLAIIGIISALIFSNLISGMNSFKNVNKQISLHDESNYVMTRMVNNIFEATSVNVDLLDPLKITVTLTKRDVPEPTIIEIKMNATKDYKVYINEEEILSDPFSVVWTGSSKPSFSVNEDKNNVSIKMTIQDHDTGRQLELTNKVSFVNVENGEGAK